MTSMDKTMTAALRGSEVSAAPATMLVARHHSQPVVTSELSAEGAALFIPPPQVNSTGVPQGQLSPSSLSLPSTIAVDNALKPSPLKPLAPQRKSNRLNKKSASTGSSGTTIKKKNKAQLVKQNPTYSDSDETLDDSMDADRSSLTIDQTNGTDGKSAGASSASTAAGTQGTRGPGVGKERGGEAGGGKRKDGGGGGGVWEVLEGLRNGQQCNDVPNKFSGIMMKTRKWPMKGWHKRFFVLENGILCYAKSMADIQRGRLHGTIDVGLSVVTCERNSHRIDVDADDIIYHLKTKTSGEFESWIGQLKHHRLYRQHEVSLSGGLSRDMTSRLIDAQLALTSQASRSISAQRGGIDYSSLSSSELDKSKLDLEAVESQLLDLGNMLARLETRRGVIETSLTRPQTSIESQLSAESDVARIDRSLSSSSLTTHLDQVNTSTAGNNGGISAPGGATSDAVSGKKDKTSFLTKRNSSSRNLMGKKDKKSKDSTELTGNGMLSAPLSAGVQLSTSNPDLVSIGVAKGNRSTAGGSGVDGSSTTSDEDKVINSIRSLSEEQQTYAQLYSTSKSVHFLLKSVTESVSLERQRLAKAVEAEKSALQNSNSALMQSLKSTLTEVLEQNTDLRRRLSQVHETSSVADLKPVTLQTYMVSMSNGMPVAPPRRRVRSRTGSIGGISQTTEFYDAAECLSTGSSYESEEEEDDDIDDDDGDLSDMEENNNQATAGTVETEAAAQLRRFSMRRRSKLPSVKVDSDVGLFSLLRKNIGKDLSKISMPVALNEPLNALQRLCEELEYSELLDRAAETEDPHQRMVLVAAFSVSTYSSTQSRSSQKPFNPLLGETYECIREDKGWKFMSEQVSHHPPISACHCISDNFILWQDAQAKTKFWGKSLEIHPSGLVNLRLIKFGELYSWNKATSCVHNLLGGGQRYVDHYGEVTVSNHTLGISCKLTFAKAGYWSSKKDEVYGSVLSSDGKAVHNLFGKWTEGIYCGGSNSAKCIWRPGAMPPNSELYYGFTRFALELNEIDKGQEHLYPSTDTRFRPDQRLMEEGKLDEAEEVKKRVEQLQRDRTQRGESVGAPRWFIRSNLEDGSYTFNDVYWVKRQDPGFSKMDLPALW